MILVPYREELEIELEQEKKKPVVEEKKKVVQERRVIQFSKAGVYIATYNSVMDAERETGLSNSNIVKACRGKLKTAGGFIWRYTVNGTD